MFEVQILGWKVKKRKWKFKKEETKELAEMILDFAGEGNDFSYFEVWKDHKFLTKIYTSEIFAEEPNFFFDRIQKILNQEEKQELWG